MLKVIIAGGRDYDDYVYLRGQVCYYLQNYTPKDIEIVSGGAKGADTLGERFAKEYGCGLTIFKPDWARLGKRAGIVRNEQMGDYADALIAFWDGESRGTKHMIEYARQQGMQVAVVRYPETVYPLEPNPIQNGITLMKTEDL